MEALPAELLNLIVQCLDRSALLSLNRVSKSYHESTIPAIWREVHFLGRVEDVQEETGRTARMASSDGDDEHSGSIIDEELMDTQHTFLRGIENGDLIDAGPTHLKYDTHTRRALAAIKRNEFIARSIQSVTVTPSSMWRRNSKLKQEAVECLIALFRLRLKNLRKLRVELDDQLSWQVGMYLLDLSDWRTKHKASITTLTTHREAYVLLDFLEAHPGIDSLAWNLNHIFNSHSSFIYTDRFRAVSDRLSTHLTDLQLYLPTYAADNFDLKDFSSSAHRVVCRFLHGQNALRTITLKGRLHEPDFKLILQSLRECPLEKINLFGASSPHISESVDGFREPDFGMLLEQLEAHSHTVPTATGMKHETSIPLCRVIAAHYASNLRELRMESSDYWNNPGLSDSDDLERLMLTGIKYLERLEFLSLTLQLDTFWEDARADREITEFWKSRYHSSSTALVSLQEVQPGTWQARLRMFEPESLASQITQRIGPHLHATVKARGVHVRVLFLMQVGELHEYSIDVHIGLDASGKDQCKRFSGPHMSCEASHMDFQASDLTSALGV